MTTLLGAFANGVEGACCTCLTETPVRPWSAFDLLSSQFARPAKERYSHLAKAFIAFKSTISSSPSSSESPGPAAALVPGVDFALGVDGPGLLTAVVFRPAGVDGREAESCIGVRSSTAKIFYEVIRCTRLAFERK